MELSRKERREERRRAATAWLDEYMKDVVCAHCGGPATDWHHEDHPQQPNVRVSSLRTQGASIERIKQEIDRCIPLCRRCHMVEDGRLEALKAAQPYKKGLIYTDPGPCSCCGKITKPLRNGMCSSCDNHHSGRRLRKTSSCDGCCAADVVVETYEYHKPPVGPRTAFCDSCGWWVDIGRQHLCDARA